SLLITGCQVRNGQSGIIIDGIADDVNGVNIKKNNINVSGASVNIQSNALTSTWRMPLFTNNMMIAPTAINMQNSAYLGFYNNSMYGTINIWFSSTNLWMTNNVVVNDTIHSYLFSLSDKTTYHADHNDFYAPLASPMFYVLNGNPNSCNNLATFQQSTGEDQHSLNVPPYFISQTDLHSYSPDLKFHGLSIPEVWDDIDGEIRNTVPDIGADEYHSSSLPPHAFFDYDCGLGNYAIQFLDTSVRATSYLWNFGDLSTSTLEFPSHTWAGYGPYNVTLVVTNNFGVDTISDSVHFVQNIPTVALNGNLLTATGGPYTAYQWNFNGTPINTATSSSYTAPFPGLYSVSVWEAGSTCPYTTSDIDVGIEEQNTTDFSLFPNPFDQSTTLFFPSSISGDENEIVLTDLQGRIVRTEKVSRADTFTLQRGNLEAGIYFCTVKSDGKNVGVKKIVVR
ncbi:MAG TPA: PKD domain-containing protein, partial [Bacteroidia bacterium]|nr:PKD domain-containing protein [Bacteroidia bacterium]